MVNADNFFDLYDVFLNEVVGDIWLFIIIGLIFVVYFSIKVNMPFQATIMISTFWLLIIIAAVFNVLIYTLILLSVGTFLYFMISRAMRRG